jgi:hypothetical protein
MGCVTIWKCQKSGTDFRKFASKGMDLDIHFLWWEGCPSHPEAWQHLQEVLHDMKLNVQPESIEIKTDEEAEHWHFLGSPTILVNGQDIDPNASTSPSRLTCRLYFKEDGRPSPLPSKTMIQRALERALIDEA